ncbi:RNA polymerase sigma factor [Agrococcus sp. SGAir0287]|uniref:RNA polymerase sigma factor n=1 Tax=Agrococcus sp. SGAir0287 TaxID=2070347 RepID=UPI0010CD115B|nr:sigma-70 family RNA polymerase sigma factor [Agrococcus sp. SGAir0287]QCR18087.1 hypothetical protein C1N71_00355 [Agrococcus sp. SGAir0287]
MLDAPSPDEDLGALATADDATLVALLRQGSLAAYETLWTRHVDVALRVARRVDAEHAEDLVSEAFLQLHDQVAVRGGGPTSDVRGYLLATVRHAAQRSWRRRLQVVPTDEAEPAAEDERLGDVERQEEAARLLRAFRSLPPRWQRVLWSLDVEGSGRTAAALELGLQGNAVSALHGRAKRGLRVAWLREHVAADLRDDARHVAHLLPELLATGRGIDGRVEAHLATCARCVDAVATLREVSVGRAGRMLPLGCLAALAVALPSASSWVAPAAVAATVLLGVLGSAAAIVGTVVLGGAAPVEPVPAPQAATSEADDAPAATTAPTTLPSDEPAAEDDVPPAPSPTAPTAPTAPTTSADDEVALEVFLPEDGPQGMPQRPAPPAPAEPGTVAPPAEDSPMPAPVVATAAPSSAYLAPVLSGTATPGSRMAIAIAPGGDGSAAPASAPAAAAMSSEPTDGVDGQDVYTVAVGRDGAWSFDVRTLGLRAGQHVATVWTVIGDEASAATTVPFEIVALGIEGFPEYDVVTLGGAMDGATRFTLTGPPSGSVCIDSDTGQSAIVPLDAAGSATRSIRFLNYGIYVLRLTACDGTAFGPDVPRTVSVVEGFFDPYVLDDVRWWELDEPGIDESWIEEPTPAEP